MEMEIDAGTLAAVLDEVIPASADGRLPAAGALGLAAYVAEQLARMPELAPPVAQGLAAVATTACSRDARGFVALPPAERLAVLRQVEIAEPAFLATLTFLAYTGYYHHARVLEALGVDPRPPHPQGYEMAAGDLESLLEPVRRRQSGRR